MNIMQMIMMIIITTNLTKNNDFIKKIDCDNINSNLNGLDFSVGEGGQTNNANSPLATGDVASAQEGNEQVEEISAANSFGNGERYNNNGYKNNNGNFVLECINNNINSVQRPAAGLPSPSIADITMYQVLGPLANTQNTQQSAISRALCDPGDIAFNGGITLLAGGETLIENLESSPEFDSTMKADVGWFSSISEAGPSFHAIQSVVTCLDNPPEHQP